MSDQRLGLLLVGLRGGVKGPDLEDVVAAARDESSVAGGGGSRSAADDAAGGSGGGPRDRVDSEAVGGESGVVDAVVLELEDAHVAVGGSAGQKATRLVGGPRHDVDRGLV